MGLIFALQLLGGNTWTRHAAAIAADPALQQAVAGVLLGCCLPAMAAAAGMPRGQPAAKKQLGGDAAKVLHAMASLMQHVSLAPAFQRQLQQTGGAQAALEHAATFVRALPTSRPGSMSGPAWVAQLASAVALLAAISKQLTRQAAGSSHGEAASRAATVEAACWQAAGLLPQLAASVAYLAADVQDRTTYPAGTTDWPEDLNTLCLGLLALQAQTSALSMGNCSARQLTCWLEALCAGLRLVPCLPQLAARLGPAAGTANGAAMLHNNLLQALTLHLSRQLPVVSLQATQQLGCSAAGLPTDEAAAWNSLPAQLWGVHTVLPWLPPSHRRLRRCACQAGSSAQATGDGCSGTFALWY